MCFCSSLTALAGSGTVPVMLTVSSGEVPQVTVGGMSAALISTTVSKWAPSSVLRLRQNSTAWSHSAPSGASGRPLRYSNVMSSGANMPARAPPSIDMLAIDMRASIDIFSTAVPQNSMTEPVPPAVPITPITWSMTSLDVTPGARSPSIWTRMFFDLAWRIV